MASTMTVGRKVSLTATGLLAALAVVGAVSIYNQAELNQTTQLIVTDPLPGMATIGGAQAAVLTMRGDIWRHIATPDASIKTQLDSEIEGRKRAAEEQLQAYEKTITTSEDRALFDTVMAAWQRYASAYPAVLALSRDGKGVEAEAKYTNEVAPVFDSLKSAFGAEVDFNQKRGQTLAAQSQQTYGSSLWVLWIVLAISVMSGAAAAAFTVKSTNRVLGQIAGELANGAEQLAGAASQVSAASQSVAQGTSEQAASLEETSASTEEISSMARRNSENSQSAAGLVAASGVKFDKANRALEQTVGAMTEINSQSGKISKIIKVIDEIAFQTNILALNAAVEAARAGEAGMGFAVVADEVRNLAQRCAQAAKDTAELIEESIGKSHDGQGKVDEVATAIRAITADAMQTKTLVDEVSQGSQEQTSGIEQIAKAVTQMQQVTHQNAASAEESASAAQELNAQAQTLMSIVERLTAVVGRAQTQELGSGAPARRDDDGISRSLAALGSAVSPKRGKFTAGPDPVKVAAGKDSFPLDD